MARDEAYAMGKKVMQHKSWSLLLSDKVLDLHLVPKVIDLAETTGGSCDTAIVTSSGSLGILREVVYIGFYHYR